MFNAVLNKCLQTLQQVSNVITLASIVILFLIVEFLSTITNV